MEISVPNLPCGTYLETWEQGCEVMNLGGNENPFEGKDGLKDNQVAWKHNAEVQKSPIQTENQESQHNEKMVNSQSLPIFKYSFSPDQEVSQSPCFQFDRLAPARVSLSPSLRKMRRKMLMHQPLQEFWEAGRSLKDIVDPPLSDSSRSPSPAAQSSNAQISSCKETLGLPQQPQDRVQSVKGLLTANQQNIDCVLSTPQTAMSVPLWVRRRGDCQLAMLDDLQQTTQDSKPERYWSSRRGSSVVVSLPELELFPGDLLISNDADHLYRTASTPTLSIESKKLKWPFTKRGMSKVKQKPISDLENLLATLEITDRVDHGLQQFKDERWPHILKNQNFHPETQQKDKKLQEAMWEIFTTECTYFRDQLLVMEEVFLNTLKYLQTRGWLLDVDRWRLFANLNELSKVSLDFLTSLLGAIQSSWDLSSLIAVLSKFQDCLCCSHQKYCLNYSSANLYLNNLKKREDFGIFLKWCEQNEQCKRLHLSDLLVSPLQRLTRYPLLLRSVWNRSTDAAAKQEVEAIIRRVDNSICDLEGKVKWLERIQKFQQLQEIIVWPPVWERNKKAFVPESLRYLFKDNSLECLLSPANRQLLYEGRLTLAGATKFLDVHLFLFDDLLLITKIKNAKKRAAALDTGFRSSSASPELQAMVRDGAVCCILEQPIPLDRLMLKNIDPFHSAGCGLRDTFLMIHQNRYQQCIGIFTLQAHSDSVKKTWMSHIEAASIAYRDIIDPPRPPLRSAVNESSEI
ncbi:pleckstrin homology domain-containing family G member 7 isoform X2 [Pristis pectinata]|uniref:pleckstrin homology domain-containing family G member 7 isoform X2 n=1 Tax=Pristis pectinata TaxID=685728 RepID=UPI00223CB894|nr:pleckstrin homology domain-containing family G member 7 isoform X2 [Pristis pectinata]